MLALKGYEKTNGFSVLNTDELFFINGGSNQFGPSKPTPPTPPSPPVITITGFDVTIGADPVSVTLHFDVN